MTAATGKGPRYLFLALILAQAAHSIEEYTTRLWEVLAPARFISGLLSNEPALGFAAANVAIVLFAVWCYAARIHRGLCTASVSRGCRRTMQLTRSAVAKWRGPRS